MIQRLGAGLLVAVAVLSAGLTIPSPPGTAQGADPGDQYVGGSGWVGPGGCAAAACHNDMSRPAGALRGEYHTWIASDKHAHAYDILFDHRSKVIEKNLNPAVKDLRDAHPEKNLLCLSCHSMSIPASEPEAHVALAEGVGCESCHGPARRWIRPHLEANWSSLTADSKAAYGLRDTKDLVGRAQACVTCHVGRGERDVNHDLIAAGHPRLNFEYGSFHANMPRHWDARKEKRQMPDLEARVWQIGQVVSAQAALELLAHRAENAKKPWIEFAEYDCFACHHDLPADSWRVKERGYAGKLPGSLPWGTWYYSALPHAVNGEDPVAKVRTLMAKGSPNRQEVAAVAREAAANLERLARGIATRPVTASDTFSLMEKLKGDAKLSGTNWDTATQRYLGMAALYHAQGDLAPQQRDPAFRTTLTGLARGLAFPRSYDSPKQFDPRGK